MSSSNSGQRPHRKAEGSLRERPRGVRGDQGEGGEEPARLPVVGQGPQGRGGFRGGRGGGRRRAAGQIYVIVFSLGLHIEVQGLVFFSIKSCVS